MNRIIIFGYIGWFLAALGGYLFWADVRREKKFRQLYAEAQEAADEIERIATKAETDRTLYNEISAHKALDHYYGMKGSDRRKRFDRDLLIKVPKRSTLSWALFHIHTHADVVAQRNPDAIVYEEEDLLKLFKVLGYNIEWGDDSYKEYENIRNR